MNKIKLLHIYRKLLCYLNEDRDNSNIDIKQIIKDLLPMLKEYLDSDKI